MDEPNADNQTPPDGGDELKTSNEVKDDSLPPLNIPDLDTGSDSPAPPKAGVVIGGANESRKKPEPSAPSDTGDTAPPPPASPVVGGRRKHGWLKWLLFLIVIAALAAGGWWYYQQSQKTDKAATKTQQNKNVASLKIGIQGADYGKLYPDMSTSEYSYLVNEQMFEGLVRYENKSKIVPDLATDWTNPDSKTWVFTIRKNVKFHDGNTLTANDVKYSLDKIIASKSDLAQIFADTIASVEATASDKVKITTSTPDSTLLNKLTFLYIIDAKLPKGQEPSQAGTGPYEIKSGTTPTSTKVQMTAFSGYHGGAPTTKALEFGSGEDTASLVKAFQNNQYDIVGPVKPTEAKKVSGATEFVTNEPAVRFIAFNTVAAGPLQKKQVREAIRYAVDPVAIGKATGDQVTPVSQLIPVSIPGHNPSITPYKQNIEKAKQLLTQAGYPKGVTVRFSTSDDPARVNEIIKELKQVGITATLDQHKDFDEFIDYFLSGKAETYNIAYSSDTLDGLDIYNSTLPPDYYDNPKLTALLDQTAAVTDPAKRLKLLQDAAVIVDQDIPVVPLSTQDDIWLMDKDYSIKQDTPSSLISVYFYNVQLK